MLYVVESPELKAIGWNRCKVGVSITEYSMIRRMSNHRTGSPVDLDVIYLVKNADVAEEQQILRDFCDFRRPGTEWLMVSAAEIIGYIEQVLGLIGVGADELDKYARLPCTAETKPTGMMLLAGPEEFHVIPSLVSGE